MFRIIIRLSNSFKSIGKLKNSSFFMCLILLTLIVLIFDIIVYFHEVPQENTINSVADIIWWNIVTLTTVGYGDMYPTTFYGKIATVIIMISGIATMAYLLSGLVEYVVGFNQKKELGLLRYNMEGHIVICNWNERTEDLVKQLLANDSVKNEIIIIDQVLEKRPMEMVAFVKGSPSEVKTLTNANISKAHKVIILAKGQDKPNADASTVLTSLAIRSLAPDVFICAEIMDENNVVYLKNAKVNEIIEINNIISRFIAQTTYNPKLLRVFNELVSYEKHSCEIYRVALSNELKELTFIEMCNRVKAKYDCIVIGLENSGDNVVLINPGPDKLCNTDYCFVIAQDEPVFS